MRLAFILSTLLIAISPLIARGQIAADLILREGHPWGGSIVESVNPPFVNGLGQVGFNALLANGSISIVLDGEQRFNFTSDTVTDAENLMGFGNAGQFIFSPIDTGSGNDSVVNQNGLVLIASTQAPGFDPGVNSTYHSGATMTDDGTAYWISGFDDGSGSRSVGTMLYRQTPDATIEVLFRSGDVVDGETISSRSSAIGGNYEFSRNNANRILTFRADAGGGIFNCRLVVNQNIVAAEGSPTGDGDDWGYFEFLTINNSGNYAFSGETNGFDQGDEFIAYNGAIQLRENDTIAQGTLVGGVVDGAFGALNGVSGMQLNESNELAFTWNLDDGSGAKETLFFASDASDLSNLTVVASVGDLLDTNGDGSANWILADLNRTRRAMGLSENKLITAEVELQSLSNSNATFEAIVSFPVTESNFLLGDVNLDGTINFMDIAPFIGRLSTNDFQAEADIDRSGTVDFLDISPFIGLLSN